MTAKERCDMAISMDADLQDDIDAVDAMVEEYYAGATSSTACAPPGRRTPSSSALPPRDSIS